MSSRDRSSAGHPDREQPTPRQKAVAVVVVLATVAGIVALGLLLREHGPGNMGNGFLQGGAVGLVAVAVAAWRVTRKPDRTTTFERAWTQSGDERDDSVLTRALAVLGLLAVPLTGAAAIGIAVGLAVDMTLALLLIAQIAVLAASFTVINRRS